MTDAAPTSVRPRPSPEALVGRARALVPALRERARECERLRRVPDATMADLEAEELFLLTAPRSSGGYGYGIREFAEVTRTLAEGCASTAWVYFFFAIHNLMFPPRLSAAAREEALGGKPYTLAASSSGFGAIGAGGSARPVAGGWRLTGRWPFASGAMNADWTHLLTLEETGGEPRLLNVLVPIGELAVDDVWHFSGMAGTGSNTLVADDLFVPEHRSFTMPGADEPRTDPERRPDLADSPLLGFSPLRIFDVLFGSLAVGCAEGALGVFRELVLGRVVAFGVGPQREHPEAWSRFAGAASTTRLARLLWEASVETVARMSELGERPPLEEVAHLRLAASRVCLLARDAIATMCDGGGSSQHHLDHPLQRFRRDVDVLKSHSYLHWDWASTAAGRALLGLEPVDRMLQL